MSKWSLLLVAAGLGGQVSAADYLTSLQPASLSPVLHPGDTFNSSVDATYNNITANTIFVTGYIQDDPACPGAVSSHPWVSFTFQQDSMPPTATGTIAYSLPFNASGMSFGSYRTNLCIYQSGNATDVVSILLKVVAPDDIFFDGFD